MSQEKTPGQGGVPVAPEALHRFNNKPELFVLTPYEEEQNLFVGELAAEAYWGVEGKPGMIHRLPRFFINVPKGKVVIAGERPEEHQLIMETGGADPVADYYGKELLIKGLRQELISPELARMIVQFKAVEDYLPDYTRKAKKLFRGNQGIQDSYDQWGNEEKNHSKVAELVLLNTMSSKGTIGHTTSRELRERRNKNLKNGWPLPFPTGRELVAYGVLQELMTRDAYKKLSDRAREENAPITADLLLLVSGDEAYHGGGYMKFLRAYHQHDPAGTVIDMLNVAREFQMPAMNLVYDEEEAVQDAIDIGLYGDNYGIETIEKALNLLGFPEITEEVAADNAKIYADKQKRRVAIFEKRMERRKSGLLVPGGVVDLSSEQPQ